jgi:hypothetical protein
MHGDAMQQATDAAERERLLEELLAAEGLLDETNGDALAPRGDDAPAPLSFAQEVLWMLDRASR